MTCRGSDTEMTGNLADLEPNGNLIAATFDGYKLSLDPLATYQVDIESGRCLDAGLSLGSDGICLPFSKLMFCRAAGTECWKIIT